MAKFHGIIGFAVTEETSRGIWEETIVERTYYGDLLKNSRRLDNTSQVNDSINVSNRISIVADPYAALNFHAIRYVEFMNAKWKVSEVEVQYPRLILTIGGLYNVEDS